MDSRIKAIRADSGKTQVKFAESLGLKQSAVTAYECGSRIPSDRTIKDICRVYKVREAWLRTGEEPMYEANAENELVVGWAMDVLAEGDPYKIRFIETLAKLKPEQWDCMKKMMESMLGVESDE